jgi:hypothetical protein
LHIRFEPRRAYRNTWSTQPVISWNWNSIVDSVQFKGSEDDQQKDEFMSEPYPSGDAEAD